jgi:hypothetical protein
VPCGTREQSRLLRLFTYGAVTRFGLPFQIVRLKLRISSGIQVPHDCLTTPILQRPVLTQNRFRLLPVRSPLLRESRLISFPSATEMFQFTEFPTKKVSRSSLLGCPIRRSPHQSLLATPRSFSQLSTSFVGYRCLGILHAPLVA